MWNRDGRRIISSGSTRSKTSMTRVTRNYSAAVSSLLASAHQRYDFPAPGRDAGATLPHLIRQHFTVAGETRALQAQAWSDYVGRILESPVARSQQNNGFKGEIDSYVLSDMIYLDSRTDPLSQARTAARISRDNVRDYVFHVAVEGIMETVVTGKMTEQKSAQFVPGILALDMGQPMRMMRPTP